jgi:hypothetical protein
MQNGKSRATAESAADVEAAQHTISISNALRMTLPTSTAIFGLRANRPRRLQSIHVRAGWRRRENQ